GCWRSALLAPRHRACHGLSSWALPRKFILPGRLGCQFTVKVFYTFNLVFRRSAASRKSCNDRRLPPLSRGAAAGVSGSGDGGAGGFAGAGRAPPDLAAAPLSSLRPP